MLTRTKINWHTQEPDIYPCFLCGLNKATVEVKLYLNDTAVTNHICNVCNNLPDTILEDMILRPEKKLIPVTHLGWQETVTGERFLLVNRLDGRTVAFNPALHKIK